MAVVVVVVGVGVVVSGECTACELINTNMIKLRPATIIEHKARPPPNPFS